MNAPTTRRSFLKQTLGLGLSTVLAAGRLPIRAQTQNRKPNVLFIIVDDLGWADLGCYGNPIHETPNVDKLAAEGVRFTQAYTPCAVCSPTRAAVQTGKYPIRMGITDWIPGARKKGKPLKEKYTEKQMPLEEVTIAEACEKAGYETAFIGKWHLGETEEFWPEHQGYKTNLGGHSKGSPPGGYFAPYNNPRLPSGPDGEYLTDRLGDEAVGLLKQFSRNPQQPFFLMLAFYTVHTPLQPKPELEKKYAQKIEAAGDQPWTNARYAAMVQSMDENTGKVLDALKRLGLEENTLVIFTSDNGGLTRRVTSNHPLRSGKGYYYEGGIRVPAILNWTGKIKGNRVHDCPVISMDLYPTVLDLAGLPSMPAQHLDGLSLVPLLEGRSRLERDTFYWHYPHYHGAGETPCSAIRRGDYKLIRHYEDGRKELYNIKHDIGETNNLAADLPEKTAQLERTLDAWLEKMNAYIPVRKQPKGS